MRSAVSACFLLCWSTISGAVEEVPAQRQRLVAVALDRHLDADERARPRKLLLGRAVARDLDPVEVLAEGDRLLDAWASRRSRSLRPRSRSAAGRGRRGRRGRRSRRSRAATPPTALTVVESSPEPLANAAPLRGLGLGLGQAPTLSTRVYVRPPPSPSATEIVSRSRPGFVFAGTASTSVVDSTGQLIAALGEELLPRLPGGAGAAPARRDGPRAGPAASGRPSSRSPARSAAAARGSP